MLNDTNNPIEDTTNWFRKAVPEPTPNNIHTQMGVHFEEVKEMCEAITPLDEQTDILLSAVINSCHELGNHLKANDNVVRILSETRKDFLDALCDQIVTAIGCAHMHEMDIIGGYDTVNRSNWSKFDDDGNPIFDENQKVSKGPNYIKADLGPYV